MRPWLAGFLTCLHVFICCGTRTKGMLRVSEAEKDKTARSALLGCYPSGNSLMSILSLLSTHLLQRVELMLPLAVVPWWQHRDHLWGHGQIAWRFNFPSIWPCPIVQAAIPRRTRARDVHKHPFSSMTSNPRLRSCSHIVNAAHGGRPIRSQHPMICVFATLSLLPRGHRGVGTLCC